MEVKNRIRSCGLCQQSYFNWRRGNFCKDKKDHYLIRVPAKWARGLRRVLFHNAETLKALFRTSRNGCMSSFCPLSVLSSVGRDLMRK